MEIERKVISKPFTFKTNLSIFEQLQYLVTHIVRLSSSDGRRERDAELKFSASLGDCAGSPAEFGKRGGANDILTEGRYPVHSLPEWLYWIIGWRALIRYIGTLANSNFPLLAGT